MITPSVLSGYSAFHCISGRPTLGSRSIIMTIESSTENINEKPASDGTNAGSHGYVIARLSGSPEVLLILLKMSAVIKLLCLC